MLWSFLASCQVSLVHLPVVEVRVVLPLVSGSGARFVGLASSFSLGDQGGIGGGGGGGGGGAAADPLLCGLV